MARLFASARLMAIVTIMGAAPVHAADGNQIAYTYAMRCFAANAVAINRSAENPNGSRTEAIRAMAKHDNDVVYRIGGILGYSQQQISDDFDRAQATESRILALEPVYFAKTKADCVILGLM